jgi:hypothetical protein
MLKSPKQRLIERMYGPNLETDVQAWIADGKTWREMAEIISARCDYQISYESLRRWYANRFPKATMNVPLDDDPADDVKQPA